MIEQQINLTWLRTFEAAARHLNFTEASKELGLTQTAVSLHIRSLEGTLGNKLFVRRARHLALSEIGQAYVPTVRQALADINLVTTSLFGPITTNMITIKAPISTATLWLAPRLSLFKQDFPSVDLRLVSSIWTDAANMEDIDVEIRLGHGDWTDTLSEKLSDEYIVPICSASRLGSIKEPSDFLETPLIHILGQEGNWERYLATHDLNVLPDTPKYFLDTTTSAIELVAAGGGCGVVLDRLIDAKNAGSSNVVRAGSSIPFPQAHYLMRRKSKRAIRPEIELFESWLREQFT